MRLIPCTHWDPCEIGHVYHSHPPGRHYGCPGCESRCHCNPGETACIFIDCQYGAFGGGNVL